MTSTSPPPAATEPAGHADALDLALLAGEILLRNGAETWRVEDTVVRLLAHFGARASDVIATVTGISVSSNAGREWLTRVRRVRTGGFNLARVDAVNALSRRAVVEGMSAAAARTELRAIEEGRPVYADESQLAAGLLTASGFTFIFGGSWRELLAALPGALVLTLLALLMPKGKVPALAATAAATLGGVLIAIPAAQWLGSGRLDVVILSTVVILVPGATLVSAISDLLGGQLLSGLARGASALLITAAIAVGVVVGLALTGANL
jgi:uncharacterized membrane protein YjjP (DUF1212 family)